MKNRQLLIVFLIGILIGAITGILVYRFFSRSNPYSIHATDGGHYSLKIDKRTGETWMLYDRKWHLVETETSNSNQPHTGFTVLEPAKSNQSNTGDWLERLLSGLIGGLLTVLGFVLTSIWKTPRPDSNKQDPTTNEQDHPREGAGPPEHETGDATR